eukprot:1230257-Rhodomonas_salina.1
MKQTKPKRYHRRVFSVDCSTRLAACRRSRCWDLYTAPWTVYGVKATTWAQHRRSTARGASPSIVNAGDVHEAGRRRASKRGLAEGETAKAWYRLSWYSGRVPLSSGVPRVEAVARRGCDCSGQGSDDPTMPHVTTRDASGHVQVRRADHAA